MEIVTEKLNKDWRNKGIESNKGEEELEIMRFEQKHNIKFPKDFRDYLLLLNGMTEQECDGLAQLWSLKRFGRITEFHAYSENIFTVTEKWDEYIPNLQPNNFDGKSSIFTPLKSFFVLKESGEGKLVEAKWLLPQAEAYFIFGDYNICACYWAIKLTHIVAHDSPVIVVYDNDYRQIADSFAQFITLYVDVCPESLI